MALKEGEMITTEFRVAFSHVFEPQEPLQEGGQKKYTVTMLFSEGEDLSGMRELVRQAVITKWGADKSKWPSGLRMPFRDQGEKEFDGFVAGNVFCNATSKYPPAIVDRFNNYITSPNEFYSGCFAVALINAYAYDKAGNKGVAFGLQMLQKRRDGEPLDGRQRPDEVFQPVEDAGDLDTGDASADGLFD